MTSIAQAIYDATRDKQYKHVHIALNEFKIVKTNNGFAMLSVNHEDLVRGRMVPTDPLAVAETVDSLVAQVRAWAESYFPAEKPQEEPAVVVGGSLPSIPPADSTTLGTFGWALNRLRNGDKVARRGWNGKGMWLSLYAPTDDSMMTLPFIYMKTALNDYVPWLASQTDMLADDWHIV